MLKWIWNIVVWVMIVLGLGVMGVWVGSYYWKFEGVWHEKAKVVDGHRQLVEWEFFINPGSIQYLRGDVTLYETQIGDMPLKSSSKFTRVDWETPFWASMKHFEVKKGGLRATGRLGSSKIEYVTRTFPIWTVQAPFVPFMLYGVWRMVNWRKRRQRKWLAEGRCCGCGYDLRASPDRCPECGRER